MDYISLHYHCLEGISILDESKITLATICNLSVIVSLQFSFIICEQTFSLYKPSFQLCSCIKIKTLVPSHHPASQYLSNKNIIFLLFTNLIFHYMGSKVRSVISPRLSRALLPEIPYCWYFWISYYSQILILCSVCIVFSTILTIFPNHLQRLFSSSTSWNFSFVRYYHLQTTCCSKDFLHILKTCCNFWDKIYWQLKWRL